MTDLRKAPFPKSLLYSSNRAGDALSAFMEEWAEFEAAENSSYLSDEAKDCLSQASVCLETLRANLSMWTK